ncbi:NUDIX domain-containing protein [Pseudoalteromonas sp. MMG005]|uniref:NUDIX hydrolase n=1 Tax=Pseudoalteromonas sp. MMG005 TaxID=2822682 RepID=UPI001B39E344|nr:NUDIX domain-containing protein [Pseudoalteromonas sp. MMG005]MBQ4845696.1 NUDIX domain-containing protein [Pseudoalteromonas sp. MMG005]
MRSLNSTPVKPLLGTQFTRQTTRAIVLDGDKILLLYTARYDDYTLPGGGVDSGESIQDALLRELQEETGVRQITQIEAFGRYEEYRPWYKNDFNVIHIVSDCYICDICGHFDTPKMEDYETANGMSPIWVDINTAIEHNKKTLANSQKQGLSLIREISLLEQIKDHYMTSNHSE